MFLCFFWVGPWMRFVGWKETTMGSHLTCWRSLRRQALQLVIAHAAMRLTRHMTNIRVGYGRSHERIAWCKPKGSTCWFFQRSGGHHHLGCLKPCKQQRMFTISTGDRRISEPSTGTELEVSTKPPAESGTLSTSWWLPSNLPILLVTCLGWLLMWPFSKRFAWRIIPISKWLATPIYKPWIAHLEGEQLYLGDL